MDDRSPAPGPLDVVVATAVGSCEMTLRLRDVNVTVGDIAAALGWRRGSLRIDGAVAGTDCLAVASGLRRGSVLTTATGAAVPDSPVALLRRVAGPDAGPSVALEAGMHVLGASTQRCLLTVDSNPPATLTDLIGGTRRVLVPGASLRIGDDVMVLDAPEPAAVSAIRNAPSRDWTEALRRHPPPPLPPPPPVPLPPESIAAELGLGVGTFASLVALGGSVAAAVLFHQPALLILGGCGALSGLASGLWHHRRRKRHARLARHRAAADVAAFGIALARHVADTEHARWAGAVDVATAVQRATSHDRRRLWERRPGRADFGLVTLGVGNVPWSPTLDGSSEPLPDRLARLVKQHDHLRAVPVTVTMTAGTTIVFTGDLDAARAVARSAVIQLAVTSGPADLTLSIAAASSDLWRWSNWLPHTAGGPDCLRVTVVDGGDAEPAPPTRSGATLVVAGRDHDAPAWCTHVLHVERDARLRLVRTADGHTVDGVIGAGASEATAVGVARALARYRDPELRIDGGDMPTTVALGDLLGPTAFDAKALTARWCDAGVDAPPRAPIGVGPDGVFELDLARDGPHALIAGTTGSGKSALLQTLVAGLAANAGPDQLTFVLVDYKGGSAFDACAQLPHVVGLVTDLDGHVVGRALRSLEAELRRRERMLRRHGVADLTGYRLSAGDGEPMPRLVIVVDEFAALAEAWPEFLRGLVGVAQRGRSLGVNLVLATQRPSGVVNEDIRANTNVRIALRVQDSADSVEVVGSALAASIPRDGVGRAIVRLGSDEVATVQVAHAAAPIRDQTVAAVEVSRRGEADVSTGSGVAALERFVAAARDALSELVAAPPRRPWLDPLPALVALADLAPAVALVDDPGRQEQRRLEWDRDAGHLVLYGQIGSGTTTTLAALGLALAGAHSPVDLHLYVADLTSGALGPLAALPHCAAVAKAGETERLARLVRRLRHDLDRRRADGRAGAPEVVMLVDGIEALRDAFDDAAGQSVLDDLDRLVADGPGAGIVMAATAERVGAVPATLAAVAGDRWVFRLADPLDARTVGTAVTPERTWPAGRAVSVASGLEMQVGWPGPDLAPAVAAVAAKWPDATRPAPIEVLPRYVPIGSLRPPSTTTRPWAVPVGIADRDLEEAALVLHDGDHVLVAGPSRSGRSSVLTLLARQLRGGAHIAAIAPRPSPLREAPHDQLVTDAQRLVVPDGPTVVLVDDAEWVADGEGALAALLAAGRPDVHVVAAVRAGALRASYGHWAHGARRSRLGILLQPDPMVDGDLLGAVLPRRAALRLAGRGYLVLDGDAALAQFAV